MLTYTYRCRTCDHTFVTQQRITDEPGAECPKCEGTDCHRQIVQAPPFHLRGGGWYADGYSHKKR